MITNGNQFYMNRAVTFRDAEETQSIIFVDGVAVGCVCHLDTIKGDELADWFCHHYKKEKTAVTVVPVMDWFIHPSSK